MKKLIYILLLFIPLFLNGQTPTFNWEAGSNLDQISSTTGTNTAITYNGGSKGLQGNFNGSTSKLTFSPSSGINNFFQSGGAIEAWINPNSDGESSLGRIVDKTQTVIYISNESSNLSKVNLFRGFSGANGWWVTTNTVVPNNKWTHVLIVYNSSDVSNDPVIYINGKSVAVTENTTPTGTIDDDSAIDMVIGNNSISTTTFDGKIAKIRTYNSILTIPQIADKYSEFQNAHPKGQKKETFPKKILTDLSSEVNTHLGSDIVTNGGFDTDSDWTKGTGWTISGGTANYNGTSTSLFQPSILTAGQKYEVTFTVSNYISGTVQIRGGVGADYGVSRSANGTYTEYFTPTSSGYLGFFGGLSTVLSIDNIICKPVYGLQAAYNMKRQAGNVLTDLSGNGNTGTVYGTSSTVNGLRFDGVDDLIEIEAPRYTSVVSMNARIKPTSLSTYRYILSLRDASSNCYIVAYDNVGVVFLSHYQGGYTTLIKSSSGLKVGTYTNLSVILDSETPANCKIYFDGVEQASVSGSNLSVSAAVQSYIGSRGISSYYHGEIEQIEIYNRSLTETEIINWNNSYADNLNYRNTFKYEGVGNAPFGWTPGTGTYAIAEYTTADAILGINVGDKYVNCSSSGKTYFVSEQAYGTWEFDVNHKDASNTYINFISNNTTGLGVGGYQLIITTSEQLRLNRTNAAILLSTAQGYITSNINYRIRVIRTLAGVFTVYIKGGAFTDWTLVDPTGGSGANPSTDNTYTTSKYTVIDNDTNDQVGRFIYRKGIER